jgi:hypothetical protein
MIDKKDYIKIYGKTADEEYMKENGLVKSE